MFNVSLIAVVDDDQSVRESLHGLLRSLGYKVQPFACAEDFLNSDHPKKTDCLILDMRMPGMSGLELQRQLKARAISIPIIFITAHGDEEIKAQVLGGGAVAFLVKPFSEDAIIGALTTALHGK